MILLTVLCPSTYLSEWLHMPQGAAGAQDWFVSVMLLVTAGLGNVSVYLDDAIGCDYAPMNHASALAKCFAHLSLHKHKLSFN